MALDRQKILSELGSVVNQLQSADCGCMGKLFSNPGQENYNPNPGQSPMTGYNGGFNMRNYYGHGNNPGFNSPCAGEPCANARRCLGCCDPPKLYSDTYNYLNRNLMQPVVQEVYQDLKSINPENTIMNSPMGAQMGLPSSHAPNQGNMGQNVPLGNPNMHSGHDHGPHVHFGHNEMNNPNNMGMSPMGRGMEPTGHSHMGHGMGQVGHSMDPSMGHDMGHMRQQIVEEQGMRHMGHNQGMGIPGQNQGMVPVGHQPGMGQEHVIAHMGQGLNHMGQEQAMGQMGQGMEQRNLGMGQSGGVVGDMGQTIMKMMTSSRPNKTPNIVNPPTTTPGNMPPSGDTGLMADRPGQYHTSTMQNNAPYMQPGNMQQGHPEMQTTQYMSQQNTFPGVTGSAQNNQMHGNMNQMISGSRPTGNMNANNLHNQGAYGKHTPGISKFNEMFPGVMKGDLGFDPMAIAIQMNPANQQKSALNTMEKLMMNNSRGLSNVMDNKGNPTTHMEPVINAAHAASARLNQPHQQKIEETDQRIPESQLANTQMKQQVYSMQNEQIPQGLYQPPLQQQQQQMIDPNTGAVTSNPPLPTVYEGAEDVNDNRQQQPPVSYRQTPPDMYKDPILPADTSRNLLHSHHFNHVTKPPKYYEYNTIGQPVERHYQNPDNRSKYSNVKQTVSKTALVETKPIGRIPSRTQQQVIYNQYKGSQSFTQQNIKSPVRNVSHSDPRIAPPQNALQAPIEKFNGDSAANDEVITPVNVKFPNLSAQKAAEKNVKLRNGLQDQTFSAFPSSAKWSFHGNNNAAPYSVGYRFRTK